ncbi:MAG: hypothetical protein JKY20_10930 [Alphaproteobacteria bacterium]|nr:hypothetical protein [Alphaproteobacteria bacterium]
MMLIAFLSRDALAVKTILRVLVRRNIEQRQAILAILSMASGPRPAIE